MSDIVYGLPPAELADVPPARPRRSRRWSPVPPGWRIARIRASRGPHAGAARNRRAALRPGPCAPSAAAGRPPDRAGAEGSGRRAARAGAEGPSAARPPRRPGATTGSAASSGPLTRCRLAEALDEGAPRHIDNLALCTQPGIFSWDRLDPGSALLLATLPALKGAGADLGCGLGILARAVLASPAVTALTLVDIDRRAVEMARRNVDDPRGVDPLGRHPRRRRGAGAPRLRGHEPALPRGRRRGPGARSGLHPPRAARCCARAARLWLVANAHLPYEGVLCARRSRSRHRRRRRTATRSSRRAGERGKIGPARQAAGQSRLRLAARDRRARPRRPRSSSTARHWPMPATGSPSTPDLPHA